MVTWSEHCRFQLSESLQPYSFTWLLPFCHMAIGNSPWMQVSASETHGTQWRNFQPAMLDDTEAHGLGPAMIPPKMVSLVTVRSSRFIPWISTDIPIKHTHTYIYYILYIIYIIIYSIYILYTDTVYSSYTHEIPSTFSHSSRLPAMWVKPPWTRRRLSSWRTKPRVSTRRTRRQLPGGPG